MRITPCLPGVLATLAAFGASMPRAAHAQAPADSARAAAAQAPSVGGQIFGSYSFQPQPSGDPAASEVDNAFVIDRASLIVRVPAGEHTSLRLTTDVYQGTETNANAYSVRVKHAFLQYATPVGSAGGALSGRIGLVPNVILESVEPFFPRFFAQSPTERAGFFSSADAGIAAHLTLPDAWGTTYAMVVNGPGYQSRERDRFKDFALGAMITPLAQRTAAASWLHTLSLSAWTYRGSVASAFAMPAPGQVVTVGSAMDRSRAGVGIGIRDPRLTASVSFDQRHEDTEGGLDTPVSPRTVGDVTGRVASASIVAKVVDLLSGGSSHSSMRLVARYDDIRPHAASSGAGSAGLPGDHYHFLVAGAMWDLSSQAQVALDYQESLPPRDDLAAAGTRLKGWFAHFNVTF